LNQDKRALAQDLHRGEGVANPDPGPDPGPGPGSDHPESEVGKKGQRMPSSSGGGDMASTNGRIGRDRRRDPSAFRLLSVGSESTEEAREHVDEQGSHGRNPEGDQPGRQPDLLAFAEDGPASAPQ